MANVIQYTFNAHFRSFALEGPDHLHPNRLWSTIIKTKLLLEAGQTER